MGARNGSGAVGRRGLLAGAAALAAGGLAKLSGAGGVDAAHNNITAYSPEGVLHADVKNTTSSVTEIESASQFITFIATNKGEGSALQGRSELSVGVSGITKSPQRFNAGVQGLATNGAVGVLAQAGPMQYPSRGGIGAAGSSVAAEGIGVVGAVVPANLSVYPVPAGRFGVVGLSDTGAGVRGDSNTGNGVFGVSSGATGAYGFSNNSFGAAGVSNAGVGVFARSASNWGLHAESPVFAGVFSGSVFVNGSFTVANGAKSAAVRNKRGEHRRVYCQESPEPWFEDFGEAKLEGGRAAIQLDPEFDDVVKGDDYQVFLTEYGDLGGLYVADRRPHRFEVRSRGGASGSFGYRIVARRDDDVGRRLEKLDVPDFSKVTRPQPPPDLPMAPKEPIS